MQLLFLLVAMTVAGSQCAQLVLQQRGGHTDSGVMADDKQLKSAADQIVRADAGDHNLLKVTGFKHAPSYEWIPATKTGGVFGEPVDDQEDTTLGQQADTENEMLSRLLLLYDWLPAQTSKWRKLRRRQDEELQARMATDGQRRQCHVGALYCSDNLSSVTPSVEQGIEEVHTENIPSEGHIHGRLREEDKEKSACCQEQDSSDGQAEKETGGPQTEVGQEPHKMYYPLNNSKRATPVGAAWRRAFNSWVGKRNPSVHGWGGSKSNILAVLGNSRTRGVMTYPSLRSQDAQTVNSRTDRPVILSIGDEPAFAILRPKRNMAFGMWDGASNHDYPSAYGAQPAYGAFGGKGESIGDMSDLEQAATFIKRGLKFSAWGGKRYFDGDRQGKRGFSSWSGKRSFILDGMTEDVDGQNKRAFSAWGGKREPTKTEQILQNSPSTSNKNFGLWPSDGSTQTALRDAYGQLLEYTDCRAQFRCEDSDSDSDRRKGNGEGLDTAIRGENAEHGLVGPAMKRSDSGTNRRTRVSKTLFTPWRGKRSDLLPPIKLASIQYGPLGSKKWGASPSGSVFSNWAGKRSDRLTGYGIQSVGRQFPRVKWQETLNTSQKW